VNLATLKNTYLLSATDANPPTLPAPVTYADSKVTPLIGCAQYAPEVAAALAKVGTKTREENRKQFVLVHNWWLGLQMGDYVPPPRPVGSIGPGLTPGDTFYLDGIAAPPANVVLADVLKQKAQAGVEVRVLGWISFALMGSKIAMRAGGGDIAALNSSTMASIVSLRAEPALNTGAMLDILGHTGGAVHTKLVVIGDETEAIGFTGGIDFVPGRWAETWHDIAVKVEGPAVQALYDWFRLLWNENANRNLKTFDFDTQKVRNWEWGTVLLKARTLSTARKGKHHVQSMRTVPVFRFKKLSIFPQNRAPAAAPNGLFEIRAAWQRAISAATDYIYMEDQSFWSAEVLGWANAAIKANPNLRVILMASGGSDPNDPVMPDQEILTLSIDQGLLAGLTPLQCDQVRMFRRFELKETPVRRTVSAQDNGDDTSDVEIDLSFRSDLDADALKKDEYLLSIGPDEFPIIANPAVTAGDNVELTVKHLTSGAMPAVGAWCTLRRYEGVTVHSKTTLVDDHWAIAGSANCMRRSLYTDWEHSVVFVDEDDEAVKEYRKNLWAHHFAEPDPDNFDDLDESFYRWEPTWGTDGGYGERPPWIAPVTLPINGPAFTASGRRHYEMWLDTDSRQPWGGFRP
jgi:phosphatidylserine/phosphatidylglycerophosphate/cardiolipin synthase-like enzyme